MERTLWVVLACLFSASHGIYPPRIHDEVHVKDYTGPPRDAGDTSLGRLPTSLYPLHYTIELQHDIYSGPPPFAFNGSVEIMFECQEATDIVYLNSRNLVIPDSSIEIFTSPDTPVASPDPVWSQAVTDDSFQFFKLYLNGALTVGATYVIRLTYSGTLNAQSRNEGAWWDSYVSLIDGTTKYIVSTQYEDSFARESFPCFDEPSFKATHDVILWRKDPDIALSNMPKLRTETRADGWFVDYYDTSVKMSVYLVAFVIGEFDYMETLTSRGIPVRVWTRPEYKDELAFANSIAAPFQDWYETYTGIDYPLPKQDHIALPGKWGAMENWGLVIYGEYVMLYNETYDTLYYQRFIALIIGHEIAHTWFGNLVTCDWWDNIWLNEGFATFFETLPFDDVLGWSGDEMQFEEEVRYILGRDSVNTSVAVRLKIDTPYEASSCFTFITYCKGGAIVRMIYQIFGPANFAGAMTNYLTTFSYGNADTDGLWQSLTEYAELQGVTDTDGSKLFFKQKFDPWTDTRGYPLVTADRVATNSMQLSQTMFLKPNDQEVTVSPFGNGWYTPMTWTDQVTQDYTMGVKEWLNQDNKTVSNGLPTSATEWVLVNIDQYDYQRVLYDDVTYGQLTDQLVLDPSVFPFLTRFELLNDAFEIARAGYKDEVFAMDTTKYLDQEDRFLPWDTFERVFRYQAQMLNRYPDTFSEVSRYIRSKVDSLYDTLGWDNLGTETNYVQALRAIILELSCIYHREQCIQEAQTIFANYEANPTTYVIPPDQQVTVYCAVVRAGGANSAWDFIFSQYDAMVDDVTRKAPRDSWRLLQGLACPDGTALLETFIAYTFDTQLIRAADTADAWEALTRSPDGPFVAWNYLKANWNTSPVPPGVNKYSVFLSCVSRFGNQQDVDEVNDFILVNPPVNQDDQDAYDEALAIVSANKAWNDVNNLPFQEWLRVN